MSTRQIHVAEEIAIVVLWALAVMLSFWFGMTTGKEYAGNSCLQRHRFFTSAHEFTCEEYKP